MATSISRLLARSYSSTQALDLTKYCIFKYCCVIILALLGFVSWRGLRAGFFMLMSLSLKWEVRKRKCGIFCLYLCASEDQLFIKEIGQHKCRIKFYAGYVTSFLFLVGMGVALWQKVYSGVLPWEVDTHFEFYLNSCLECWSVIVFCSYTNLLKLLNQQMTCFPAGNALHPLHHVVGGCAPAKSIKLCPSEGIPPLEVDTA